MGTDTEVSQDWVLAQTRELEVPHTMKVKLGVLAHARGSG
jgi:hypothetical protein